MFKESVVNSADIVKYLSEPDRKTVKCKGTFNTPCDYVCLRVIYSAFLELSLLFKQ